MVLHPVFAPDDDKVLCVRVTRKLLPCVGSPNLRPGEQSAALPCRLQVAFRCDAWLVWQSHEGPRCRTGGERPLRGRLVSPPRHVMIDRYDLSPRRDLSGGRDQRVTDAVAGEVTGMAQPAVARPLDPSVCAHWRLTAGRVLGDRVSGTWEATRDGAALVVKYFDDATFPDWRYPMRVAASLRALGWPTPEPVDEPLIGPNSAWVLLRRLPGRPVRSAEKDQPAERRARGRLLAELHFAAAAIGIDDQRGGFAAPAEVVADPELTRWLRMHEVANPDQAGMLRRCQEAAANWFADHTAVNAPRSVIHGDFTPWNLLFDNGRLTGVVDFEASHHTFQVADFAMSWRGYQDDVLRGYDEVRALSDIEWQLVRPVYWAWLFIGVKHALAAYYGSTTPASAPPNLEWQLAHIRKHSSLIARKAGPDRPWAAA